ncbi:LamG domain-containing protein [Micromonospora sp. CPCC 205371]|nr:LamG domain-containing protein [Micromonospora sp. CPCC 205371]
MRNESREVYALPSGGFEMVQHSAPVRARVDGRWVPVDTRLTRMPDGGVAPTASTVDLRFSGGGDGPFVRMTRAGRELAFSWPGRLPVPVLDGDAATYVDVLPGVDLRVRADVDGFAHVLVVKTPQAARNPALSRVRFGMSAPGLTVTADPAGALRATDGRTGGPVFEAAPPVMWDTAGAAARSVNVEVPGEGASVARLGVEVRSGELTLTPDPRLLASSADRFPVSIDPQWKTVGESARLMVSSGYPTTTYYNWDGTEGVGLCDVQFDGACVKDQVKRLFFRMPIGAVAGRHIISTEFVAYEHHAHKCGDGRVVQLWHASAFGSSSTWNSTKDNWNRQVASRDVAYCSRTPVEFSSDALRDVVHAAAQRKDKSITFGLRAYSEETMDWWKRFGENADLRIHYNTRPPQPRMKDLSMSPGGPCVDWTKAPVVNRIPTLYAILHDADSGSAKKVHAQFSVSWDGGKWTSALIGPKTTGSTFQVTAPAAIAGKTELRWEVRAWDGFQWSPWSWNGSATSCNFGYDPTAPTAPTITSTAYPPSDPENPDDPWIDGVGRYGVFTLSTTHKDVNRYWVGVNASPTQAGEHRPASPGGPVSVQVAPTRAGVNFLYVKALDAAGNVSAPATYMFRVNTGSAPKAHWTLDEPAGSTVVTSTGGLAATVQGGVTLGVDGQAGTALRGNGSTGYAETAGPVIDTSKTFAVSAWARLANKNGFATVVNQDGAVVSGFYLQYSKEDDRWAFSQWHKDALEGGIRVLSTAPPDVGEWTHLLGVYDSVTDKSRLYVNGVLQQELSFTTAWRANGPLGIGRAKHNGVKGDFFPGDIDDVRVFDRLVTADEAADLFQQHPVLAGRWTMNTSGADGSGKGRPLTLAGSARIDAAAGWLGSPQGGLVLDGAGDYAATAGPVLTTHRSFTIAGWARAAATPTGKAALFSQEGAVNSGFTVRYDPAVAGGDGGWQVEIPTADTAGAATQAVEHSAYQWQMEWDHVAIAYDSFADALHLYVNGALEEVEERVSSRWHVTGFNATKGLQVGRSKSGGAWGEYWPGVIDDVWAFSGALSEDQVQVLAGYTELPSDSPF